jgi:hypothetical protein
MNPRRITLLTSLTALLATACTSLQQVSSGELGCAPGEVRITDVRRSYSATSWQASCSAGPAQRCSMLATADAAAFQCTPLRDRAEEPAAARAAGPTCEEADDDAKDARNDASDPAEKKTSGAREPAAKVERDAKGADDKATEKRNPEGEEEGQGGDDADDAAVSTARP